MVQMFLALCITSFLITGCGSGGGDAGSAENNTGNTGTTENSIDNSSNFAYKTQGSVKISLLIYNENISSQKQILLYESQKTMNDPDTPGELIVFDGLLAEGVTNSDGSYSAKLTLGNHIDAIWIVIPALAYEKQHQIINGQITLTIYKGAAS